MPQWKNIFELYFIHKLFFLFQHKLHQNTNMYNYDGNDSRVGRDGCSDGDESFGYDIIDAIM